MNLPETAELLDHAAAIDPRFVPTVEMARAWQPILANVDKTAALAAVDRHYAASTNRILPADIKRAAAPRSREQWLV